MKKLTLTAALALALSCAWADDVTSDLAAFGKLKAFKKTGFYELKYKHAEPGEKPKSAKAYLKLDEAAFFADQSLPLAALQKGTSVWIYGKPVERSITDADGSNSVDRQIVNTTIVAFGDALTIDANPDKKGPGEQVWLKAEVTQSGQGLRVTYEGNEHKVVMLKAHSIFKRQALPEAPKKLKKGLVAVLAQTTDDRPEKGKADVPSFSVTQIVILDKRLSKTVYPLIYR